VREVRSNSVESKNTNARNRFFFTPHRVKTKRVLLLPVISGGEFNGDETFISPSAVELTDDDYPSVPSSRNDNANLYGGCSLSSRRRPRSADGHVVTWKWNATTFDGQATGTRIRYQSRTRVASHSCGEGRLRPRGNRQRVYPWKHGSRRLLTAYTDITNVLGG